MNIMPRRGVLLCNRSNSLFDREIMLQVKNLIFHLKCKTSRKYGTGTNIRVGMAVRNKHLATSNELVPFPFKYR